MDLNCSPAPVSSKKDCRPSAGVSEITPSLSGRGKQIVKPTTKFHEQRRSGFQHHTDQILLKLTKNWDIENFFYWKVLFLIPALCVFGVNGVGVFGWALLYPGHHQDTLGGKIPNIRYITRNFNFQHSRNPNIESK